MTDQLDPTTVTRYLLGELAEEERDRVERTLLEDGAASDAAAAAEDDLLDAYVAGELPRASRRAFERRLRGSADLRQRAAFARALARTARGDHHAGAGERQPGAVIAWPARRRSVTAPFARLATAASVLLAVTCGWLVWRGADLSQQVVSLQGETRQLESERDALAERGESLDQRLAGERTAAADLERRLDEERARRAELEQSLARREAAPPPEPPTASFVLSAALRSELGERRFELPAEVERVRLTLGLGTEEGFTSYLAVVTGPTGDEVWSERGLPPAPGTGGTAVELTLPATVLAAGRHEALLYGEGDGEPELLGAFEFEPVRR